VQSACYLGNHRRLITHDLDEARATVSRMWERHRSELLRGRSYGLRWHQIDLPGMSLAFIDNDSPVSVECSPLSDVYRFTMHESGFVQHRVDGRDILASPTQAIAHAPSDELLLRTEPFRALLLTFSASAVETALARHAGGKAGPLARAIPLQAAMPASLQSMCRWAANEFDNPASGLLSSRRALGGLKQTLLAMFTSCIAPAASDEATGPERLRRVEEWLDAHATDEVSIIDMAAVAGASVRAVQAAFQRWRGCTPMQALVQRRLRHARMRLLTAPPETTVTDVAFASGFFHLSRFAAQYRRTFGERPSETLVRGRSRRLQQSRQWPKSASEDSASSG
jgi:AraC-like DNA-binding protein